MRQFVGTFGSLSPLAVDVIMPTLSGMEKIIVVGMLANTCVEATARCGAELGYHVTLVRDATAAFSSEAMHAAHEIDGPTFAHATTDAVIAALEQFPAG